MTYTGTIVEESLLDSRIINDFKIIHAHISRANNTEDRWHLYKVEASEQQIETLSSHLKSHGWYVHFWQEDKIIVIFPHKKFTISHSNKTTWIKAINYGISIGIPREQLDFPIDGS